MSAGYFRVGSGGGEAPTPGGGNFSIGGSVFLDINLNGLRDTAETICPQVPIIGEFMCTLLGAICDGGVCWFDTNGNDVRETVSEPTYSSGANIVRSGLGSLSARTVQSNSIGAYNFSGLSSGPYSVSLEVPVGYTSVTDNPLIMTIGPNAVNQNFGLLPLNVTPTPTSIICPGGNLVADPRTVIPSEESSLSLINCLTPTPTLPPGVTPTAEPTLPSGISPTPSPYIEWIPPICGTVPNTGTINSTFTAPPAVGICTNQICPVEVEVTANTPGGLETATFSENITVTNRDILNGVIYSDTLNNNCTSGSSIADDLVVELWEGTSSTLEDSTTTDITGTYTLENTQSICTNLDIVIPGEEIKQVRVNGGSWISESGNDYNVNLVTNPQTVDFCIESVSSWFQVTTGDVRFPTLINPIPGGLYGATDSLYPGIYISSLTNIATSTVSQRNWKVEDEYALNGNFQKGKGGMAYEFFTSRVKEVGQSVTELSSTTIDLSSLSSGVYHMEESVGNALISSASTVSGGKHIVLLIEGDATISNTISVPPNQGNLFIMAVKGNITIGQDVGTTTLSSTTPHLEGYYSAQGDIILSSKADCTTGTPDERLNVGGSLIANALYPFSATGGGRIQNDRTLCAQDATYPALYVATRPDFLTQLTDFYKTRYKSFQEVNP